MPWSDMTSLHQRVLFIADVARATEDFSAVCRRFGVSRKTGYKWVARYAHGGPGELVARSPRPLRSPTATPQPTTRLSHCGDGIRAGDPRSS